MEGRQTKEQWIEVRDNDNSGCSTFSQTGLSKYNLLPGLHPNNLFRPGNSVVSFGVLGTLKIYIKSLILPKDPNETKYLKELDST